MTKKTTYPVSGTFTWNGKHQSFVTQLYQVGVYCIVNNDPAQQCSLTPKDMAKFARGLRKDQESGKITDLQFGREIIVSTDTGGLWYEVKD